MATTVTKSHYEQHSSETYEKAFFYEAGAYMEYLVTLVQEKLQLSKEISKNISSSEQGLTRVLLDVGGGTGNFTKELIKGTSVHAIVVDPFLIDEEVTKERTTKTAKNPDTDATDKGKISFVKKNAEIFANHEIAADDRWWRTGYNQVLMKEVVHHIPERVPVFRGIYNNLDSLAESSSRSESRDSLPAPPALLIITRPQKDVDYPLWEEARAVWAKNQPSLEEFESELSEAGFRNIRHTVEAYPCKMSVDRWFSMVRGRFWSTFSNFTDDELEKACETMRQHYEIRIDESGCIRFEDRLLFITACK